MSAAGAGESTDPRVARSRAAVLEATLALLAEQGFAGLSIDAISKASGVARTTIYRHWSSLGAVVHEAVNSASPTPAEPRSDDPWADLRAFVHDLARRLNDSDWGRIFPSLVDAAARDEVIYELQTQRSRERRGVLVGLIRRAQAAGRLDAGADADFLAEMLSGPLFARRFISHLPVDGAFVERLLTHVLSAAGPTPRPR